MSHRLEEISWQEFEEKKVDVAIIPVGSVEQHGYHLPLGTDSYVAKFLAEEAAEKSGVIVTPPVWFGWSPHHMALPGTVTVRAEILIEFVYDIIESLFSHGCKNFILLNGHRIVNISWMQIAAQRAQSKLKAKVVIFDPGYMSKDANLDCGALGHAEEIETSHMLHILPKLVHMEKAVDNPAPPANLYSVDPRYTHDTLCYVPATIEHIAHAGKIAGGTTGSPTKSSAEMGKKYHEHVMNRLLQVIQNLRN